MAHLKAPTHHPHAKDKLEDQGGAHGRGAAGRSTPRRATSSSTRARWSRPGTRARTTRAAPTRRTPQALALQGELQGHRLLAEALGRDPAQVPRRGRKRNTTRSTSTTRSVSRADSTDARGARVVVEHVRRVHPGPVVALDDVSLTLEPGEFVVLTGPSGSGKTSLLSIIGDLDRPTSGTVEVDGIAIAESPDGYFHRDVVGFVFQHHHLLAHLPARVNVEIPLIGAGVGRASPPRASHGLLDGGRARAPTRLPRRPSVGGRAPARRGRPRPGERPAPAARRRADRRARQRRSAQLVLDLLEDARARRGMTLLVVSYDEAIGSRADRRLYMRDGRLGPRAGRRLRAAQHPRGRHGGPAPGRVEAAQHPDRDPDQERLADRPRRHVRARRPRRRRAPG